MRYFLALARAKNFTRAAEECNVSQPSLSRAIAQLEAELGGPLVRRERNLTHLTDLGQRVLPLLTQSYESALSAREIASALNAGEIGTLRLALADDVSVAPFANHLTELLHAFPGLTFEILRGRADAIAATVKDGSADFAIAEPVDMAWERFESWALFSEPLALALAHHHMLANSGPVAVEDLMSERILIARGCSASASIEATFAGRAKALALVDAQDALALAEIGGTVAVLPITAMQSSLVDSVPVSGLNFTRELRLYAVRGRRREAPAAMFVTQMRAADWSSYVEPEHSPSAASV